MRRLQLAIQRQGEPLPRWGADGVMGSETIEAAARVLDTIYGTAVADLLADDCISAADVGLIMDYSPEAEAEPVPADGLPLVHDLRVAADEGRRIRKNPIRRVDTVVLHQTAARSKGGAHWQRWKRLGIHYVVTYGGDSIAAWMHSVNWRLPHGHGWNGRSVGIEIEGYFAGQHDTTTGKYSRFWRPKSTPNREPMVPDPMQLEAARQAVKHAILRVAQLGGRIRYLGAHRQSYGMKSSDPGELLWRGVALPLFAEGIIEPYAGALPHSRHPGKPIPEVWGGEDGVPY